MYYSNGTIKLMISHWREFIDVNIILTEKSKNLNKLNTIYVYLSIIMFLHIITIWLDA